jgi:hypothetical protein
MLVIPKCAHLRFFQYDYSSSSGSNCRRMVPVRFDSAEVSLQATLIRGAYDFLRLVCLTRGDVQDDQILMTSDSRT